MDILLKVLRNEKDFVRLNVEGETIDINGIVVKSMKMIEAIAWTILYSKMVDVICICGESGAGKEMLFNVIKQYLGSKKALCVNCGAMTDSLLESELFGHKKGSFTDASSDRKGAFLEAEDGLLFLDEIGEMSLRGQAKLLRAIEYKEIKPVGSDTVNHHNAKVILATNRDLLELINKDKFRKDLFYRIEGFTVNVPPLRERKEDIVALSDFFTESNYKFSKSCFENMQNYSWPGNVRELKNAIQRAKIKSLYGEKEISWDMLGISKSFNQVKKEAKSLKDMEKILVEEAYLKCDYNISNTSRMLGIPRSTLYSKLKRFELIA